MLLLTRARFWRLLRLRCVAGEVADSFRDVPIDGFRDLRIDRFREGFRIDRARSVRSMSASNAPRREEVRPLATRRFLAESLGATYAAMRRHKSSGIDASVASG